MNPVNTLWKYLHKTYLILSTVSIPVQSSRDCHYDSTMVGPPLVVPHIGNISIISMSSKTFLSVSCFNTLDLTENKQKHYFATYCHSYVQEWRQSFWMWFKSSFPNFRLITCVNLIWALFSLELEILYTVQSYPDETGVQLLVPYKIIIYTRFFKKSSYLVVDVVCDKGSLLLLLLLLFSCACLNCWEELAWRAQISSSSPSWPSSLSYQNV